MQELDLLSPIDQVLKDMKAALKAIPDGRRTVMEAMANEMQALVNSGIGGSEKVQGWQEKHVGSGGGYAAIRPKPGSFSNKNAPGGYAYGQVTNAIENGHKIRRASGNAKEYRPRIHRASVNGKYFYLRAAAQVETVGYQKMQEFVESIAGKSEGAG